MRRSANYGRFWPAAAHDPVLFGVATSVTERNVHNSDPARVAQLIDLDPSPERVWLASELGAILQHQLSVPVEFEMAGKPPGEAKKLSMLTSAHGLTLKSFADLLAHPHPPIELLVMLKDFAKSNASHHDSALPADVSRMIYYLAIAVALLRCGRRITSMSNPKLVASLTWAIDQPWIEPRERTLLSECLTKVTESGA